MTLSELLTSNKTQKIGNKPVVVLPLKIWREIEAKLEDLEMAESGTFREKISKVRGEKKLYSSVDVKKSLGL